MKNSLVNLYVTFEDESETIEIGADIHSGLSADPDVMAKVQELFNTVQVFFSLLDQGKTIRDMTDDERKAAIERAAANTVQGQPDEA